MTLDLAMWVFFRLQRAGVTYARASDGALHHARQLFVKSVSEGFANRGHDGWQRPGGYQHRRGRQ